MGKLLALAAALALGSGSHASAADAAYAFDGVNDYATLPAGTYFQGDFTVEAWVYLQAGSGSPLIDFSNGTDIDQVSVSVSDGAANRVVARVVGATTNQLATTHALPTNQWVHVAVTLQGTAGAILLNGQTVASGPLAVPRSVTRTQNHIGRNAAANSYLKGRVDELRIWRAARSEAAIRSNMLRRLASAQEPDLLVAWPPAGVSPFNGLAAGAASAPDWGDRALRLFGQGSVQIDMQDAPLDPSAGFSVEAWVYRSRRVPERSAFLLSQASDPYSSAKPVNWALNYGWGHDVYFETQTGSAVGYLGAISDSVGNDLNQWHHLVGVYANGVATLYVDGVGKTAVSAPGLTRSTAPLWIGLRSNYDASLDGFIDEVRIWSRPRTPAEILDAYKYRRLLSGTEPGLVAYYQFNEDGGPQVVDSTGRGRSGTLAEADPVLGRAPRDLSLSTTKALQFGVASSLSATIGFSVATNAPHAVEAWIKPLAHPSADAAVLGLGNERLGSHRWLLGADGTLRMILGTNAPLSVPLPLDRWTHLLASYNGTNYSVFTNDTAVGETRTGPSFAPGTASLFLGASPLDAGAFTGLLDDVRVWSGTRVPTSLDNPAALLAFWSFDEGAAAGAVDASTNRRPTQITGFAADAWKSEAPSLPRAANLNLTANPSAQGLWRGQVTLNKVSEAARNDPALTPSGDLDFTVLFHVDRDGKVRLLKDVTMMSKRVDDKVENVLLTDDRLIPNFQGILRRNGKLLGVRLGAVSYDFSGLEVLFQGGIGPARDVQGTLVLPAQAPANPFLHKYHPDHAIGKEITRVWTLRFDPAPGGPTAQAQAQAQETVTGKFSESISGPHQRALAVEGVIELQNISRVAQLNQ